MFGRSSAKQVDDEPDWREKLADLRDSPPWVFERPSWMSESPGALVLLFAGVALTIAALVYFVVPPTTLPAEVPGAFSVAAAQAAFKATSTTTTRSTTTTLSPAAVADKQKLLKSIATAPAANQKAFVDWIHEVQAITAQNTADDAILATPVQPPFRRWAYGIICASIAAGLLSAAWFVSDARSRRIWGT